MLSKRFIGTVVLQSLNEKIDSGARDQFAWNLFELWAEGGANTKAKWAMGAIGHLGDDGCVLKLTPLVRKWLGESQPRSKVSMESVWQKWETPIAVSNHRRTRLRGRLRQGRHAGQGELGWLGPPPRNERQRKSCLGRNF